MNADRTSAAAEWRAHWLVVMASMAGMSMMTMAIYSMGLFMAPLNREFGWTRTQISSGLTIYAMIAVPLGPFVGALIDRWGGRRLAIPGAILSGLAFACFSLNDGALVRWWALWLVFAFAVLLIKPTIWTAAVSGLFNHGRGLALAAVLCGTAIGSSVAPIVAAVAIAKFGWRTAYVMIGCGWGAAVLALVVPFFFDATDRDRSAVASGSIAAPPALTGLTIGEALRSAALQKIAIALLLSTTLSSALAVHFVPILNSLGYSRQEAAGLAGLVGIAAIAGKLGTGWLYDRMDVGFLSAASYAVPVVPCTVLLLLPHPLAAAVVVALFVGWSSGAYLQAGTYLTSRFAGMRNFGKIYGFMASLLAAGAGLGPLIGGIIFDRTGGYAILLWSGIAVGVLCGVGMSTIGDFPRWRTRADADEAAAQPIAAV